MGADKKKSKKHHKHHKKHRDEDFDDEELERLNLLNEEEIMREFDELKEQLANTSKAPSVATRSVAGGGEPSSLKRRSRIEEEAINELEIEKAKKRKIKEK